MTVLHSSSPALSLSTASSVLALHVLKALFAVLKVNNSFNAKNEVVRFPSTPTPTLTQSATSNIDSGWTPYIAVIGCGVIGIIGASMMLNRSFSASFSGSSPSDNSPIAPYSSSSKKDLDPEKGFSQIPAPPPPPPPPPAVESISDKAPRHRWGWRQWLLFNIVSGLIIWFLQRLTGFTNSVIQRYLEEVVEDFTIARVPLPWQAKSALAIIPIVVLESTYFHVWTTMLSVRMSIKVVKMTWKGFKTMNIRIWSWIVAHPAVVIRILCYLAVAIIFMVFAVPTILHAEGIHPAQFYDLFYPRQIIRTAQWLSNFNHFLRQLYVHREALWRSKSREYNETMKLLRAHGPQAFRVLFKIIRFKFTSLDVSLVCAVYVTWVLARYKRATRRQ